MLNAIIIEDEKPAMELLVQMLGEVSTSVNIKARLNSVKESIEFMTTNPDADIIFSDVQLSDGLSFDIFSQAGVQIPVIFITGYDDYMMRAFENNGIDYLMKPVSKTDLDKALLKYNKLKAHFSHTGANAPVANLERFINARKKTRLLVKRGMENIAVLLEDIVLIYTQNKLVYVMDRFSKKYVSDKTLTELEEELDHTTFFRVNRQYIININYVKSFKSHEKVKLLLDTQRPGMRKGSVLAQVKTIVLRKGQELP